MTIDERATELALILSPLSLEQVEAAARVLAATPEAEAA